MEITKLNTTQKNDIARKIYCLTQTVQAYDNLNISKAQIRNLQNSILNHVQRYKALPQNFDFEYTVDNYIVTIFSWRSYIDENQGYYTEIDLGLDSICQDDWNDISNIVCGMLQMDAELNSSGATNYDYQI